MTSRNSADIEHLETRLHRGWEVIDEARRDNDDRAVARFTERWLMLLQEYERLVDSADPASPPPSPSP